MIEDIVKIYEVEGHDPEKIKVTQIEITEDFQETARKLLDLVEKFAVGEHESDIPSIYIKVKDPDNIYTWVNVYSSAFGRDEDNKRTKLSVNPKASCPDNLEIQFFERSIKFRSRDLRFVEEINCSFQYVRTLEIDYYFDDGEDIELESQAAEVGGDLEALTFTVNEDGVVGRVQVHFDYSNVELYLVEMEDH